MQLVTCERELNIVSFLKDLIGFEHRFLFSYFQSETLCREDWNTCRSCLSKWLIQDLHKAICFHYCLAIEEGESTIRIFCDYPPPSFSIFNVTAKNFSSSRRIFPVFEPLILLDKMPEHQLNKISIKTILGRFEQYLLSQLHSSDSFL